MASVLSAASDSIPKPFADLCSRAPAQMCRGENAAARDENDV